MSRTPIGHYGLHILELRGFGCAFPDVDIGLPQRSWNAVRHGEWCPNETAEM
jgi:hypothetical protein